MKLSLTLCFALVAPLTMVAAHELPSHALALVARNILPRTGEDVTSPVIPDCSSDCYNQTISTDGCALSDLACHCTETDAFQASYEGCVVQACTLSDQEAYLKGLLEACSTAGVAVMPVTSTIDPNAKPTSTSAAATSYPKIPPCAFQCFNETITTDGCSISDVGCHCGKTTAFRDNFNTCVAKDCGPQCQSAYETVLTTQCQDLGYYVPAWPATPQVMGYLSPGSPSCPADQYPAVPGCSQSCYNQTIVTDGCCEGDSACHCSKTEIFQDDFNNCVVKDCPARKDQKAYIKALKDSCASVCVTVPSASTLTLPPQPTTTRRIRLAKMRRDDPVVRLCVPISEWAVII
ncbi:MAG: hypothetical protein M1838_002136 [Thelocarpon superellum]|nr:MAG: hypothetical protein M1838_002136 [Thelocarpon superellum]